MRIATRWQALLLAALLALTQTGCAARSKAERAEKAAARHQKAGVWLLSDYFDYQTDEVELRIEKRVHVVAVAPLRAFAEAAERIVAVGPGIHPIFLIVEGKSPNAFATIQRGHPVVAVNLAMIELLGEDRAMWAALIGHELAHLALDHHSQQNGRRDASEVAKGAVAIALAVVGIPFGLLATDTAVTAAGLSYSRADERSADAAGVEYLGNAGYDPQGAIRFQEKMAAQSQTRGPQFWSTHPTWEERIEELKRMIEDRAK